MEHLSSNVKDVFRWINDEHKNNIIEFIRDGMTKGYYQVEDNDFVNGDINYEDCSFLREYSGFNYKHINNALRGIWNYEENGHIKNKDEFINDGRRVFDIIENNPSYVDKDFRVYRGVTLSYFDEYKLNEDKTKKNEIKDLVKMKGQFMYDSAFVSTSINLKDSFFKKENELGLNYNVLINYLMPADFDDGIFLTGDMSYSNGQKEYLINKGNLSYVTDVKINEDGTAYITAIMVPKKVYDPGYDNYRNELKSR